jgi:hypothetical protein
MVDTADASWAQEAGNRTWLSIENEGRVKGDPGYRPGLEVLTDAQLAANAQLLAYAHRVLRIPLQLATTPAGRGLGHHSMGADWGHQSCPGTPIIAQKPEIVRRAIAIVNGEDDMAGFDASDAHYLLTYKGLPADAPTMSLGSAALSAQKHAASADAKLDGLMVKVDALTAAVHVLAAGGTDVDTHAVIAAINAVGDRQTQTVANLQARLAAAEAASAAALAAGPPAGS